MSAARINSGIGEGLVREEMQRARRIRKDRAGNQLARVIELQSALSQSQLDQGLPPQQIPTPE